MTRPEMTNPTITARRWARPDARPVPTRLGVALLLALGSFNAHADEAAEHTTTLPTVTVTGATEESATGPVNGHIATRSATATKTDTPLVETPQSVSVITADRIRDQGARTVQETLRYSAGVYAETYGLDSRGDWSLVRGTAPVQYLDGLQQSFGAYTNVRPDPFTLERVEVLKGPSSVLYGQGSVGGITNLVSKRPLATRQGEMQVQLGNHDLKQFAIDVTGPVNDDATLLYRLVAVGRESGTQVNRVDDDRRVLMPSLTWRPDSSLEWTVSANLQKDKSGSTTQFLPHRGAVKPGPPGLGRIPIDVFMSEPGFDAYDTEQKALTSQLRWSPNETWTFRQNLRYSESEVDYRTLYPAFPPDLQDDGTIDRVFYVSQPELKYWTVDHQAQAEFGTERVRHTVLAGFDFQRATTNRKTAYGAATPLNLYDPVYGTFTPPDPSTYVESPENTVRQSGFYLQDQITFDERWIAVLGLRHDTARNSTEGSASQTDRALTKRLALMYKADNGVHPYVSWSESFKPEIGLDFNDNPFKPLEGEQIELGLKYQPAENGGYITAALYDLREKNRKVPDPVNPSNQIQVGEARSRGIELEALLQLDYATDLIAGYSYTDTKVLKGSTADEGKRLPSVPEHLASLWLQHRFAIGGKPGFIAGAGVRYIGSSWDGRDALKTPGYTLVDAMFGYQSGPWNFALNLNNLTDKTYYTTCLARGDCFVGTKRSVVATVGYRF